MEKTIIILVAVAMATAFPYPEERPSYEPPEYEPRGYEPHGYEPQPSYKEEPKKPYAFDYGVRDDYSGANYGHAETSNGNSVEGSYQVALPDGRIQIVKYIADHKNGFQAQVEYEGEAKYPEFVPHKQPTYKAEPEPYQPYKPQPAYEGRSSPYSPPQYHPKEGQYQEVIEEQRPAEEYIN